MPSTHASRSRRRVTTGTVLAIAAASALAIGCGRLRGSAPSPDIQTTKMSAHQLYRAAVRPDVTPIPVRRLQRWTLHLDTADGRPVDVATITMNGGMPQHGHGLPTSPRVSNWRPCARFPSGVSSHSARTRRTGTPTTRVPPRSGATCSSTRG